MKKMGSGEWGVGSCDVVERIKLCKKKKWEVLGVRE
jgi:hypothetical protein